MAFVLLANSAGREEERKHALCRAMSGHCLSLHAQQYYRERRGGGGGLAVNRQFL